MLNIETLNQTSELMVSGDYKQRFIAEYYQLKIRYEKLKNFNNKIRAAELKGEPEPKHDCPLHLLVSQESVMKEYLDILEYRAVIENIDLKENPYK